MEPHIEGDSFWIKSKFTTLATVGVEPNLQENLANVFPIPRSNRGGLEQQKTEVPYHLLRIIKTFPT